MIAMEKHLFPKKIIPRKAPCIHFPAMCVQGYTLVENTFIKIISRKYKLGCFPNDKINSLEVLQFVPMCLHNKTGAQWEETPILGEKTLN